MTRRIIALLATLVATATVLTGIPARAENAHYDVSIRWTEGGIPHILGSNYADIGYGYGYAIASQALCVLADTYTTVDARRSLYFGPTSTYAFRANSTTVTNLNSDAFYQSIINTHRVEKLLALKVPLGPRPEVKQAIAGYVDGYNRYLREIGGAHGVKDPACHDKPWVKPISQITAYRRFYQLALLASSGVAIDGIGSAAPPTPSAPVPTTGTVLDNADAAASRLGQEFAKLDIGSNAVALGVDGTRNHHGMLLGNPHFPWIGSERFFEAQLTIPGILNVSGASLYGVPIILIGHNDKIAWSHTVSTAYRFTPYQLTLVPGSPTTYLYGGVPTRMISTTVTIPLAGARKVTRTLYSTRYGPMLTSILGLPIFPWTPTTAFTMRDANADNFRYVNHFFEMNLATSTQDALGVLKRNQGIPWVNTIVADTYGKVLYADISVTPNVPNEMATECNSAVGVATYKLLRLPVLDASLPGCDWRIDRDALQPGTFGPSHMPYLIRDDYVTNSNDSYWLSNPNQPLVGFARIIGDEETARSLRTRIGLIMVGGRVEGTDGKPGRGFSRQELQDAVFSDRLYAGELARDSTVAMCRQMGGFAPTSGGPPVAVGKACDVLAAWDLKENVNSRGALLFRRFFQRISWPNPNTMGLTPSLPVSLVNLQPWANAFQQNDPVNTPNTLNTALPQVRTALGDAISDLNGAHIPLDATVGSNQYDVRNGLKIPIHGGPGPLGEFNAINVVWNAHTGYQGIPHGSSFVQVVSFNGTACPDTRMILTYSQSPDPTSPHFADQTLLFSRKQWLLDRFCESQIGADPELRTQRLSA